MTQVTFGSLNLKMSTMEMDFGYRLDGVIWFKNALFYLKFPVSTFFLGKRKENDICRMLSW